MRNLIAAATLLLAGCSATQDELRRDGRRYQASTVRTPIGAASCLARNIEEANGLTASIGERESGAFEVSARSSNSSSVLISARTEPILKGSHITIWISPMQLNPDDAFASAVKGCAR